MRLLQHPQRDYHDDGFHDHVVSVSVCLFVPVCECASVFAHVGQRLHCFDILGMPHTEVSDSDG